MHSEYFTVVIRIFHCRHQNISLSSSEYFTVIILRYLLECYIAVRNSNILLVSIAILRTTITDRIIIMLAIRMIQRRISIMMSLITIGIAIIMMVTITITT